MANNPQKSNEAGKDPLTAIEDALRSREQDAQLGRPTLSTDALQGRGRGDLFHDDLQPAGTTHWSEDGNVRRAANDDRAAIGHILQTLQRRPSRKPFVYAAALSALWVLGGAAFAFAFRAKLMALLAQPDAAIPVMAAIAAGVVLPIATFFAFAQTVRRTAEMRNVAQAMAEVAIKFAEPETAAREAVVNVGQAIRREVTAMGDGVERALARAAELEALVHNEVSALERAYNDNEVRIRDLLSELTNQRDTLVGQAEQIRSAIGGVHLGLTQDIGAVGDVIAERVNEVAQRVTRSLTEKGEHITLALGHAGDSMIDALQERGSTLLGRLEQTSDRATTAITSASERLTNSLTFKTDHIHDEFADLSGRLQQMMTSRLDQVSQGFDQKTAAVIANMAAQSQQMTETLADTGAKLNEQISARVGEVNNALRATGDSLVLDLTTRGGDVVAKMEQTGARVGDSIAARSNSVADTFRESAEALADSLDKQNNGVRDMLSARMQAFADVFNRDGTQLSEKIARDSALLGDLIIRHVGEFDRTVKTYGGELVEKLGQRTSEVGNSMRDYVDGFDQRVTSRTQEISTTLDQRLAKFEELMGEKVSSLAQTLAEGGKEAVAAIDARIAEAGETINKRGDDVASRIAEKAANIDTTLGNRADEVASHLDTRIGRFEELLVGRAEDVTGKIESRTKAAADALSASAGSILDRAGEAERSLTALSDNVGGALQKNAEDVERKLVALSTEVAASFLGKAEEITSTVTRQTNEMTTLLSDKSGGVLASIVEKGQQFSESLTQATEQAVKTIEDKGLTFSREMMSNSEELARMINAAGETATGEVSRTMNELQNIAQTAIQSSKQTAAASVSEMLETHNMLRADSTALYERLREANILLQEVLSGAHQNMSVLENTMMMRVSDFVSAMKEVTDGTNTASEQVTQTIGDFRETTARVVTDLGQLTIRFEQHGRELAKAIELIERSNVRTEDAVNERRVTLDSLISTLDIRTEDLDQRLKRFSALLDESLDAAGSRAREIARVVSESSVESAHVIADQFEAMREAAETERRITSEAMRSVYEQSTGESHVMLGQAAERFTEIMEAMKKMSTEMQQQLETTREDLQRGIRELPEQTAESAALMKRELEATREELRRGILELPRETADSATQMRRVLVDQIEALAELNRIVARHGRSLEQSEPRRSTRVDSPAPAARPATANYAPSRRADTAAQVAANKGWLTDLLNRASREEDELSGEIARPAPVPAPVVSRGNDERTPRHSIESLDSLSVDIARMIDHDAAADLWDRYKRGERNVFTRRLYTLQGQKAFDEIRAKYRADREFKQTVDRYVAEFERLLEDVSRDDRGQVMARTYLTSETGKVYTMLAHAAGRFDQAQ
jgi:hypothetical protein